MSAERLSRLQKWILEEVLIMGDKVALVNGGHAVLFRNQIYGAAWSEGLFGPSDENINPGGPAERSARVVFSRSVWRLIEKGCLTAIGPASLNLVALSYGAGGKTFGEFEKDFEELLKRKERNLMVPHPAIRGAVQAKLLWLTDKGRVKAKELLAAKESLNANQQRLTLSPAQRGAGIEEQLNGQSAGHCHCGGGLGNAAAPRRPGPRHASQEPGSHAG